MLTAMKARFISSIFLDRRRKASSLPGGEPADVDARRALAWLERGQPQGEIVYDDAVPRQDAAELAKFRPASYRRNKR